ncbi:YfiT family bacillithiol transferase [Paenibacillus sp. sgz500958]|uniref:YfiT family bacillithiol transferase n=1 Tax=Paenibacillus sp. sgz500958 TaxID=3242475 RepID=UPI0036D405E2
MELDRLRFPIGHFEPITNPTSEQRTAIIQQISAFAKDLRELVSACSPQQLQTPYRPGGWCIQQIIHHMADNDMNAYIRFKRALTEREPMSGTYREDLWAEMCDYKDAPIELSLTLLEALHGRFLILLQGSKPEDFKRTLRTEVLGTITLEIALQRFIWHNRHHMTQISTLIDSMSKGT